MVPPSCSLSDAELREQLARYRSAGRGAEVIEWGKGRRVIRVAPEVPASLVTELLRVERACCPCFELTWEPQTRRLSLAVSDAQYEPALDGLGHALGLGGAVSA